MPDLAKNGGNRVTGPWEQLVILLAWKSKALQPSIVAVVLRCFGARTSTSYLPRMRASLPGSLVLTFHVIAYLGTYGTLPYTE